MTHSESTTQPQLFEGRFYCKKELCKILGVSLKTIDVQMRDKLIQFVKIGSAVRFNGNYLNQKFGA